MIVAIHQPCFLPWLGYLDRMHRADLFVLLDHVQFERRNYQNRTRILVDGQPQWMTVPVLQHSQLERVTDKQIDPQTEEHCPWPARLSKTLRHAYRKAPHLATYREEIEMILMQPWQRLLDLDLALLDFLRAAYDIRTPMLRSSTLAVSSARSALILDICKAVGATAYLAGMGGSRDYLDRTAFDAARVEIIWQQLQHPHYAQCGRMNDGGFVAGLSSLDLLFNCGPDAARLLRLAGTSEGDSRATPPRTAAHVRESCLATIA